MPTHRHKVAVFETLDDNDRWLTIGQIAAVSNVPPRTVRNYLTAWIEEGLVERRDIAPAPYYRLKVKPTKAMLELRAAIRQAAETWRSRHDAHDHAA